LNVYTGVQHYALSCNFTFLFQCCDVSYVFSMKRFLVHSYPQLFVGGLMSYLFDLCLFVHVHSGFQHVLTMSSMANVLSIRDRSCLLFASTCMLHPPVCLGSVLLFFFYLPALFVFVLWLVCSTMPVFLDCPFLISPSVSL